MKKFSVLSLMLLAALQLCAAGYSWQLKTGKADGVYRPGEKIVFSAVLLKDGKAVAGIPAAYDMIGDNGLRKRGKFTTGIEAFELPLVLEKQGWVRVKFSALDGSGKSLKQMEMYRGKMTSRNVSSGVGAIVAPEKMLPAKAEPADFDRYWAQVKSELAAVPVKELERVKVKPRQQNSKCNVYDVKVACAGNMPVSGYLVIPENAAAKSCPAIVTFHGAGVVSARQNLDYGKRGMIALDINAHGIVNGKPAKFYQDLRKNHYYRAKDGSEYGRYCHWDNDNREKYYFRGMYMRVMRALEYVKTLPEWDGKNLIVCGSSQGGAQVIAACALDHDITLAFAGVPAMCDHSGVLADPPRNSGWPAHYKAVNGKPDNPAVAECVAYFDGCYFARRIKCPIYFNTGLNDATCPPTSVFAAYNSIPQTTPKFMDISPDKAHNGVPRPQFANALKKLLGE